MAFDAACPAAWYGPIRQRLRCPPNAVTDIPYERRRVTAAKGTTVAKRVRLPSDAVRNLYFVPAGPPIRGAQIYPVPIGPFRECAPISYLHWMCEDVARRNGMAVATLFASDRRTPVIAARNEFSWMLLQFMSGWSGMRLEIAINRSRTGIMRGAQVHAQSLKKGEA